MANPLRADQIGSLLRPPDLLAARSHAGSAEKLRAIEDQNILRVLAKQKDLGFEIFTDGELRRRNFMSDFTDAVEGFDFGDAASPESSQRSCARFGRSLATSCHS